MSVRDHNSLKEQHTEQAPEFTQTYLMCSNGMSLSKSKSTRSERRLILSEGLVEEISQALVNILEVLCVTLVLQIGPSGSPTVVALAVELVNAVLSKVLLLDLLLELVHVLLRLVPRREVGNRDSQFLGILRIHHGRMNLSDTGELGPLTTGQDGQLTTPAETHQSQLGGTILLQRLGNSFNVGLASGEVTSRLEEVLELLLLGIGLGRVVIMGERLAAEEIGHDDASFGSVGEKVSTLLGGGPETEDVVDYDDGLLGIFRTDGVGVETADLLDGALGGAAKPKRRMRGRVRTAGQQSCLDEVVARKWKGKKYLLVGLDRGDSAASLVSVCSHCCECSVCVETAVAGRDINCRRSRDRVVQHLMST